MDGSGNALVTGETRSTNFAGANNTHPGGTWSAFVAKVTDGGTLAWSTFFGGSGDDYGYGIAVDGSGNALVTGSTTSTNFAGANNTYSDGSWSAFVAKVSGSGTLAWSTYLGGSGLDFARGIAVDGSGNALVTGRTDSTNFAGRNNTYPGGFESAFVAKVSAGGSLAWSTYLGGSSSDEGSGIAVDGSGNALVTGETRSTDFAGTNNTYPGGTWSAFVAKVTDSGMLAWSTYLGGSGLDSAVGIAVDASGNALVTGGTSSTNFTGANNTHPDPGGFESAFVVKVSAGGTLAWSTYLGGSGWDVGYGIAVDASGNALVTGHTSSTNFAGANNTNPGGIRSVFAAKVFDSGTLAWSTYLGGSGDDVGWGIAVDASGNALVTGRTSSTNFAGANNTNPSPGIASAFVAKITVPLAVVATAFHFERAPPRVMIEFDADVSGALTLAHLSLTNLTTDEQVPVGMLALEFEPDGHVARLTFPGHEGGVLPDGVYRLTLQAGGTGLAEVFVFHFFVLAGDANRDGRVDIADLGMLAGNWQAAGVGFSGGDFNYDGVVGIADLGILAGNWQAELDLSLMAATSNAERSTSNVELEPDPRLAPRRGVGAGRVAGLSQPVHDDWLRPGWEKRGGAMALVLEVEEEVETVPFAPGRR